MRECVDFSVAASLAGMMLCCTVLSRRHVRWVERLEEPMSEVDPIVGLANAQRAGLTGRMTVETGATLSTVKVWGRR